MKLNKKHKTILNKFWKNRNNKQRSFILFVLLPTFISLVYYTFIASGQYVVEARFSVKGNEMQQIDLLSGIAGIPSQGGSSTDSYIVQDYIHSLDMVREVNKRVSLQQVFNHPDADWMSSLGKQPTQVEMLAYWNKFVTASYDPTTTIITLKVRAFSPQDAKNLSTAVLYQSEILVNNLSEQARKDDLLFAEEEVKRAEKRVANVRALMNEFRTQAQDLDPKQTASSKMMLIGELEAQLAKTQAELSALTSYMDPKAPSVINLTRKVNALTQQIQNEKNSIAGDTDTQPALSGVFADYEPLVVERTFAEKAYTSSLASLEAARVETSRKHRYLATFVEPTLPDEASEPQRLRSIITVFLASLISWAIGLLGLGIIREHIGWV
ncbi:MULTISPECIES: capsule biosynthesis protein [Vibrio]|uniref:capsule biosynthesis protein n=1 Tax=Vibrio TaxID=662 RepID=UPI0012AE3BB4|nr:MULTISPECIES: capsule biosynthesis protein [Vibrio]EGQ7649199.1 capsule biosynthesis protein [Vibrio alginolyticus]ELA9458823.1 capsule biosynthesis protein [Vibrio alginolyticus]MBS9847111.1 capsule biosynthesis protein [Vibrio alginolyticus]MBS9989411.1 capsule biosynthesis protein [Vibrio alginolyticus]MBT0076858.1 capsule biosynthesis protein [Vibrio alginolyticus]